MTTTAFAGGWDGDDTPVAKHINADSMHTLDTTGRTVTEGEIKKTNAMNTALAETFYIQDVPASAEEYEQRVNHMLAIAEQRGWYAERQVIEEHFDQERGMQIPHAERIVVNDGPSNIYIGWLRQGMNLSGIIQSESFFRSEQSALFKEQRKAKALQAKRDLAAEQYEQQKRERTVTGEEFDRLNSKLDKVIEALEQVVGPLS